MALLMFRRGVATDAVKKFVPLFDRLLVEKFAPETKTKGGIMIPEKAQGKVLEAVVLATGQGTRTDEGKIIPLSVKVGDHVLLPEYGGTKVSMENKDYFIFRESDILGKWNE
ncbi:10 kDa heat shock protein, mitochondrial [Trichinella nelsoni]|uniref:10 kDa heat shock protein, mitochondrial n=7 Tax=Trichinella TaxID=6333 RepID=A0A0V1L3J7_9BILA|nr:chaperonin, 10 kDa [Trichinella spiralis]KRX21254.1 10 kDa heat shock protein, mitochondrial [Trichinella nelsoni]KRX41743.1 10 kDa heat shock protein, mitochondrial [Trichinella murrelli]KRX60316.1 10 kDa heat shock protein, mitochondrial [Trichinella sp. T9]KRX77568.1 10 kDa heat shock protein, mitochondrial [Trichinella sp. T6]KRY13938.1 10 kDa heat shock protein, mitochondrial [Trichinella patagoniensis]KRY51675.1 10 kDa heat shock protein, mitochondrial [Trichinella britovi]KRZ53974.